MTLMLFSGAWGKMIHEKNLKQNISWHCPFKEIFFINLRRKIIFTQSQLHGKLEGSVC